VPYKLVAWVANILYREHYVAVKTTHYWTISVNNKLIKYSWREKGNWNHISVQSKTESHSMQAASFEEFIFEHYYGYTKISANTTEEYRIHHQRWKINTVEEVDIKCDFKTMYGADFAFLTSIKPTAVFITNGSSVAVDWKRNRFKVKV